MVDAERTFWPKERVLWDEEDMVRGGETGVLGRRKWETSRRSRTVRALSLGRRGRTTHFPIRRKAPEIRYTR